MPEKDEPKAAESVEAQPKARVTGQQKQKTTSVQTGSQEDKRPKEEWVQFSHEAFNVRPEVVTAALMDVKMCTREEAQRGIQAFLARPVNQEGR
jgi:hypothetical protein